MHFVVTFSRKTYEKSAIAQNERIIAIALTLYTHHLVKLNSCHPFSQSFGALVPVEKSNFIGIPTVLSCVHAIDTEAQ